MIFGVLTPEKIWHQLLVHLPTSPVYCSHLTLGIQKNHFFNSTICTYFRLFALSQKKTNCCCLTHHTWKMSPHYLVKCANFSSFSFFHAYRLEYQSAIRTSCRDILLRHGLNFIRACWTMQLISDEKDWSMYPCRRWSLWTFAVTLLAWHSICHTSQPVVFRTTNANPQPAFFRATNVWRNVTISVRRKCCAFYKVVRWHFSGAVDKGVTVCFLLWWHK